MEEKRKQLRKQIEELSLDERIMEMASPVEEVETVSNNRYHYISENSIQTLLDRAREEGYQKGKDYQASLDRTCYGTSFEKLEKGIIEDKSPLAPEKGIDWSSPMSPMRR